MKKLNHEEKRKYRKHVQRRLTTTTITPAVVNVKDGKLAEIETLSPIKVVGGLSDHEIYAEIRKRHKDENVLPYKVEKHSELYIMTLTDFMGNAELKERTLIQPK